MPTNKAAFHWKAHHKHKNLGCLLVVMLFQVFKTSTPVFIKFFGYILLFSCTYNRLHARFTGLGVTVTAHWVVSAYTDKTHYACKHKSVIFLHHGLLLRWPSDTQCLYRQVKLRCFVTQVEQIVKAQVMQTQGVIMRKYMNQRLVKGFLYTPMHFSGYCCEPVSLWSLFL